MRKAINKVKGTPNVTVEELIQQGVTHQSRGEDLEALQCFSKAISKDKRAQKAYLQRSIIYMQREYYERALNDVQQLMLLEPNNPEWMTQRGLILGFLGKREEALNDHNQALSLASTVVKSDILNHRALVQLDPQQALADFNEAIRLHTQNYSAYQNRGLLYVSLKQYDLALRDFDHLVSVNFNVSMMHVQTGAILQNQNRHDEALLRFDKAIMINPRSSEAYNNKAFSLFKQNKVDEALSLFKQAIALDPNNVLAHYNTGFLLKSMGRSQEALPYFAQAISLKYRELPELPRSKREKALQIFPAFSRGAKQLVQSWGEVTLQVAGQSIRTTFAFVGLGLDIAFGVGTSAFVNIGMELTGSVFQVALVIYDQVKKVKANKQQCMRLVERVLIVCDCVVGLDMQEGGKNYVLALQKLEANLRQAQILVLRFSEKNWMKHVLFAGTYEEQFKDLYEQLKESIQDLQLGLHAQNILNEEEARQDTEIDRQALQENMGTIIQLNMDLKAQLNKATLDQQEQSKIVAQQLASMQLEFRKFLGQAPLQSAIEPEFAGLVIIPFHTLDIQEKIGQGKLGTIYKGRYNGEVVAIKEITGVRGEEARKQFLREAKIMNHLRSRHFALFYGICCEQDRQYLVTEYLPNGSLDQYLAKHKNVTLIQRHQWMLQIVSGLQFLHKMEVYHRDLISANVLIDENGTAKIADFGMAKVSQSLTYTVDEKTKLRASSLKIYAPERFNLKSNTDPAAWDIYSVGILMWEILMGQMAYVGLSDADLSTLILSGQRETIPSYVPSFYRGLIENCWQMSPHKRPSAEQISSQLESFVVPDIDALFQEGLLQEKTHKNYINAVACYERAAAYGSLSAKTNLAGLYYDGCGVPKDEQKAHDLFLEAAQDGHMRAMFNLATLYEEGYAGKKADLQQARVWLEKAASLGNEMAVKKLAQMKPVLVPIEGGLVGRPGMFNNSPLVPPRPGAGAPVPGGRGRGGVSS